MKRIVLFSLQEGAMGGVHSVNRTLADALRKAGWDVRLLYLRSLEKGDEECHVIRPDRPWSFCEGSRILSLCKQGHLLAAARALLTRLGDQARYRADCARARKYLLSLSPDAILASHYLVLNAIPASLLSRTLHHVHTSFAETMAQGDNARTLRRYCGRIGYLWLSRAICERAASAGFAPSFYLYNPLSTYPAERTEAERSGKIVLLTRFSEEKRLPLAVELCREAFSRLPEGAEEYSVHFYGDGPEKEALCRAIGDDGRFVIEGRTTEPLRVLSDARLTLNTSRFEGFSISVLEAAACGVPTVSFLFGEAAPEEILDGRTGYLVPMDDRKAFVERLYTLLTEPEAVRSLSEGAREFAKGFDADSCAASLEQILSRLPLDKPNKEA